MKVLRRMRAITENINMKKVFMTLKKLIIGGSWPGTHSWALVLTC